MASKPTGSLGTAGYALRLTVDGDDDNLVWWRKFREHRGTRDAVWNLRHNRDRKFRLCVEYTDAQYDINAGGAMSE